MECGGKGARRGVGEAKGKAGVGASGVYGLQEQSEGALLTAWGGEGGKGGGGGGHS